MACVPILRYSPKALSAPASLDTRPVATVRLAPDAAVQKDPLFVQILQRHTNRSRYDISRAVPSDAWMVMAAAATHPALQSTPVRVDFAGLEQGATALRTTVASLQTPGALS